MTNQTVARLRRLVSDWHRIADKLSPVGGDALRACADELEAALADPERPAEDVELACPRCKEHGDAGVVTQAAGYLCLSCGHEYTTPDRWMKLRAERP